MREEQNYFYTSMAYICLSKRDNWIINPTSIWFASIDNGIKSWPTLAMCAIVMEGLTTKPFGSRESFYHFIFCWKEFQLCDYTTLV